MPATDRQSKLAANAEAIERWQRKLFRAANELQRLVAQRKRLLGPKKDKAAKLRNLDDIRMAMGGNDFHSDDIPI